MNSFDKTLQKCFDQKTEYVVLGASAGGVEALKTVLSELKDQNKLKISLVLHMHPTGPNLMAEILSDYCTWDIQEGSPGELATIGSIRIAPPDYHLSLEPNGTYSLSSEGPVNFSRPSIDILFESAAYAFGKKTLGILLTGANQDGASGLSLIQRSGGLTIVQNPKEATSSMMPESALEIMNPDEVLTLKDISHFLALLTSGESYA